MFIEYPNLPTCPECGEPLNAADEKCYMCGNENIKDEEAYFEIRRRKK